MKGTFDNETIQFQVRFQMTEEASNLLSYSLPMSFEKVYGMNTQNLWEQVYRKTLSGVLHRKILLKGEKTTSYVDKERLEENSFFEDIPFNTDDLTIEDTIAKYLLNKENFDRFSSVKKMHALAFLQKYYMEYEEVKEFADSYTGYQYVKKTIGKKNEQNDKKVTEA